MSTSRKPPRPCRSSKGIAASLYAPLVSAVATGLAAVITAIGVAVSRVIAAIRRKWKGEKPCPPP
jgi:hypothetical protein